MKKTFVFVMVLVLLALATAAGAEDLAITVLGGANTEMETVSLDDMKVEGEYFIDGYASITVKSFSVVDCFAQYAKGQAGNNDIQFQGNIKGNTVRVACDTKDTGNYFSQMSWKDSGTSADFLWLVMDITNMQKTDISFMQEASVKVVFDDDYEFGGWVRQFNYDYNTFVHRYVWDKPFASPAVIDPLDEEPIDMLYTGSYAFGCTVPMYVLESKKPLRMEIVLGDNELTYHVRK